ncbi:ABC transporter ATP-binding protein [Sporolactobacillus shoreae]|uniref:ABC transporter ATP-binding protein n=2 Tax=Sporolactobacillus shoreae TaxID=1465501 RepID=A0A4Z0GU20_9BACL|nr:ABC transporter ATP-binding protein [Sporolactobacillus shoreae]
MPGRRGGRRRGAARFAPVEKPRNMKKTLRRLWNFFAQEKKALITVSGFVIADALVSLLIPYFIGLAVNQIGMRTGAVNFPILIKILLVLGLFYMMDGLLTLLQGWIMASSGQKIVMSLRKSMFLKLQKLPIAFFDRNHHGDIMSRLTNDIENIDVTISQSTVELMNDMIMIVGSLALMIWISPLLTLASLIMVPLVFILTKTIASRTTRLFVDQQRELGTLNGQIEESVQGLNVIKAFSHENEAIRDFSAINKRLTDVGMKAQVWSGYMMPLMNVINNLGFTAVASVGGFLAVKGMITVGMIASFLTYSRQFSRPLNDVASIFNTLQSAVAGAERVFEILDEREEPDDRTNAKGISVFKGRIVFDDVSFGYTSDHPILKHVSFRVNPGESIALVGPTGAGKTTIINLLTRFYDSDSGTILADGVDITDYRRSEYRGLFGIVLQDTYLFHGSFLENLRYGKLDATEEEVINAARTADADSFIRKTEKGYHSVLQGNGDNLSEGQKQLLTIARAFLSDPAVLILDEATSHVDTQTEQKIQKGMARLMKGRTSFIIAHRLSTIKNADKILVVEDGEIAEQGTHQELLKKHGIYYEMFMDQFSG